MRKKRLGLFLFACVSAALMIPALGLGQQRGGDPTQQGVKSVKKGKGAKGQLDIGGMNLDVNAVFQELARGQDSILISNAGPLVVPLQQWARDNGNTSGFITRQQFGGFMQTYAAGLQAAQAPGKGKGAKGPETDAAIAQRFKGVDKNGDGYIANDEMSAQAKETGVWKKFDANGDGKLDLEEYKIFTRERIATETALKLAGVKGDVYATMAGTKEISVAKVENAELDKLPVVYRPGKLPPNIPAWFIQLDVDKDAQVGLYEWKYSQKQFFEFQVMDRNGDSLLTAEETLWHMKAIASLSGPGMTIAAYSQPPQTMQGFSNGGFGGFNNSGFGGFNNFGKGGGKKGDFFGGGFGGGGGKKGKKGGGEY